MWGIWYHIDLEGVVLGGFLIVGAVLFLACRRLERREKKRFDGTDCDESGPRRED